MNYIMKCEKCGKDLYNYKHKLCNKCWNKHLKKVMKKHKWSMK